MSYFKKFTDFCAGVGVFLLSLFFIRKYMAYYPPNVDEEAPSKLEQFLTPTANADYSMLIPLILALTLSVLVGRVFARLPYVCLAASLIPALYVAYAFDNDMLFDQKIPLIILVALHVIGNLAECIWRDGEDGRHRLWIGAKITSLASALFCLYTAKLADKPLPTDAERLPAFDTEVITEMTEANMKLISTLGWLFLGLLVISVILYNVYFIDAILSLVPLAYSIYSVFSKELTVAPAPFIAVSLICAATHILLAVFENNLSYKEQKEKAA